MCFHFKSIKSNLAKWFGSTKSYHSLIQTLLYWDFIIRSGSPCNKKWTSRSLRFCKSQTNLGFVNNEPFATVVFTHLFRQGSGELKILWQKQALYVREKTSPELCWQKCMIYTWQIRCVFRWVVLSLAPSSFLSCSVCIDFCNTYFLFHFHHAWLGFFSLFSLSPHFLPAKHKRNNSSSSLNNQSTHMGSKRSQVNFISLTSEEGHGTRPCSAKQSGTWHEATAITLC